MTRRIGWWLLLSPAWSWPAAAHITYSTKITWSKEIVRIVRDRCLSCHREGGSAPFSLETYDAARPWAKAIQEEVLSRRMPPWGAVKGYGDFEPDRGLSPEEINLLAEWVEGGAPEGDPALLPEKRRSFPPAPPLAGVVQELRGPIRLRGGLELLGFRTNQRARITAELPDGSREPLLWILEPPRQPTDYILRRPRRYPPGAVLLVEGSAAAVFRSIPPRRQMPPNSQRPRAQTGPTTGGGPAGERSR